MTSQDVIDITQFMDGIFNLHYSNGYLNHEVVLTSHMWNKIIALWPEVYLGSQRIVNRTFIDKLLRRPPRIVSLNINRNYIEQVRNSWKDSKTFPLNGYTMIAKVLE